MPERVVIVSSEQSGVRLDVFIASCSEQCVSRTAARRLIDDMAVTVNGACTSAHYKVHSGDQICVHSSADVVSSSSSLAPENIALDILYEDEHIVVLNKPAGMLVHPVRGQTSGTLVNALLYRYETLSAVNDPDRPGIVHRLDRETSGVMLAAKTDQAHVHLARQFEKRKVVKKYIAVVKGCVELDEGRIDAPIGKHAIHFDKKAVSYDSLKARSAETWYKVIQRFGTAATLVALFPKTGRTHQLRVHMKYIGHPVLGDEKYGRAQSFSRLALHAQSIRFRHPEKYYDLEFSVPLPEEFLHVEDILEKCVNSHS